MRKIFYLIALFGVLIGMSACNIGHTHNIVSHEAKEPTCTEEGHKAYEECTGCDYTTYEKIDALGHNLMHYNLFEPTCEENGKKEHWHCPDCGTYFIDEEGKNVNAYEDLTIDKTDHLDENNDYLCDYGCGEVLLSQEALQKIIDDTLSSTKVTVNEYHTSSDTNTSYYFDNNLLYMNVNEGENEKYYYTEGDKTYLLNKGYVWGVEITEEINYAISFLFEGESSLEIADDIKDEICEYGPLEGKTIFYYNNSLGTKVSISLSDDKSLIDGVYIYDENGNYIYSYEFIYGENKDIINGLDDAKDSLDTYKNTYLVYSPQGIIDAIDNAEISGTTQNPATIKLMKDIEIDAEVDEYGYADYGILIETGVIKLDLNGYCLSAPEYIDSVIQIGAELEELCEAVVTIEDSSIDKSGKISASYVGILNQSGTLIFNSGTIEINNIKGDWVSCGIQSNYGSVTINGGKINVTSVADGWVSSGVYEYSTSGTFTMNGGYINVNSPFAKALCLYGTGYINGGTIESNGDYIYGQATIYLGTNEEGIGATFVGGIKSYYTLNSLLKLTEGVGYYDANGNLIEVADDVTEILDKGDITVKRIN